MKAEFRYNDNVPSGFTDNSTGKPGELVPQGDLFNGQQPVVNNGDGTYTFFIPQPGISLPSQDEYWLVLSFGHSDGSGAHIATGWSAQNFDDITFQAMYIYWQGQFERYNGRTPMLKLHGCADMTPSPTPSPTPSASSTQVSTTPSAPPTPSPLTCPIHELANTMVLQDDGRGWLRYYPQAHRLRTTRSNCAISAFTIKLQDYASTYSPVPRSQSPSPLPFALVDLSF